MKTMQWLRQALRPTRQPGDPKVFRASTVPELCTGTAVPGRCPDTAVSGSLALALLILLVPLLLLHPGLGTGMSPYGGDILTLNYPLLTLIKQQLAHGMLPLWNTWAGGGYPLVPFSGLLAYPLLWPLHWLDVQDTMTLLDIAHLALAGIGVYLLAGITGASRAGRSVGALAFMLSGFVIGHLYAGHLFELGVVAWMPWVFLAAHRLIERPSFRAALLLGLAGGLQILANGFGFLIFTVYPVAALLLIGLAVALVHHERLRALRLALLAALSGAVAVGLAGVVVLPFLQSLGWSVRGGTLDFALASKISLLPAALLMAFSPDAVGTGPQDTYWLDQFSHGFGYWHEFALYVGLLPLLAAVAACLYCRRVPYVRTYAWLALLGLLLALGKYTPLYGLAFHLPGMSLVRVPARWLLATTLGVSVLAAPGVDWLLAQRDLRALWLALRAPLLAGALLIAVLVAGLEVEYLQAGHGGLQPELRTTVLPAGGRLLLFSGILALLLACHARQLLRPSVTAALLVLFVLLDLWTADSGLISFVDPAAYYQPNAALSALLKPSATTYRVLTVNDRPVPYRQGMVSQDLYDAEDYAPVTPLPYFTLLHAANPGSGNGDARDLTSCYDQRFATLMGISVVTLNSPSSTSNRCPQAQGTPQLVLQTSLSVKRWTVQQGLSWNPAWIQSTTYVYRNTAALPRAFLLPAGAAIPVASATTQLQTVLQPTFDAAHHLVYDPGASPVPLGLGALQDAWARLLRPAARALPPDLAPGQARVLSDTGNSVQVALDAAAPSYLVLDDTYYPGWAVWLDGKPAPVHRADYALRAVQVPAGKHLLTFVYAPLSYLVGLIASIGTAVFVVAALAWSFTRKLS